ncbi:GTPase IMAP family member 8-like [Xyrauchen texanus]|uniref:GTPase IMAP family member 8-like n=1 Tax=Xyrauchen texanus TaxID=154827 RepID=UPI00224250EE|nr:GTPase IMAP family member 8-like [Xyrauchen texanus]
MEAVVNSDHDGNCTTLAEIKVIIIGSKAECKCSAANAILNEEEFKVGKEIVKSEIRHRAVQNRSVTLVVTPGWHRNHSLSESSELIKMEIVHSLDMCPTPHAFLLVINLHSTFTEMHLNGVIEHMEILGEEIWNHTIVLLMYLNRNQTDADTKQLIDKAGKALNRVINMCGNRYHVFKKSKGLNMEQLFCEIESLDAQHAGQSFKIDHRLFEDMEQKRRTMKERAEERKTQVTKTLKEHQKGESCRFPELRILLMGSCTVGKTSVANTIVNEPMYKQGRTKQCEKREKDEDGQKVILIDTPGWWMFSSVKETPKPIKQEIISSLSFYPLGAHAVLLVVQPGIAFTEAHRRSIKEHMELLGQNVWNHSIVVFSWGDWLGAPTIEEHIESEGKNLQWLISKCGNRYHVLKNRQWKDRTQVTELIEKVEMMAKVNTHFLTPVEMDDSSEINLERGSIVFEPPCMKESESEEYVKKWIQDLDKASGYETGSQSVMEEISEEQIQPWIPPDCL